MDAGFRDKQSCAVPKFSYVQLFLSYWAGAVQLPRGCIPQAFVFRFNGFTFICKKKPPTVKINMLLDDSHVSLGVAPQCCEYIRL